MSRQPLFNSGNEKRCSLLRCYYLNKLMFLPECTVGTESNKVLNEIEVIYIFNAMLRGLCEWLLMPSANNIRPVAK
jgi:hypothetical protein